MAYTVNYKGYQVTCDTVYDLETLLNRRSVAPSKPSAAPSKPQIPAQVTGAEQAVDKVRLQKLIVKMMGDQRQLLLHIVKSPQIITRAKLQELMGITDARRFNGMLIGIARHAKAIGIANPIQNTFEREDNTGPRVYQYKIAENMLAPLKEVLEAMGHLK